MLSELKKLGLVLATAFSLCLAGCAQLEENLPRVLSGQDGTVGESSSLSYADYMNAVKEALRAGVERTVARLGQRGGFLDHAQVRIPMPEELQKVEGLLRRLGQDRYADRFVETMNRAAEQAVPKASGIFFDAITQMRIEDARRIVEGPNDAVTQYFRDKSYDELYRAFLPIVKGVTDDVGVTSAYKTLSSKATEFAPWLKKESLDLDQYVTRKALEGLFLRLAEEEQRIREQPIARTTEVLRKVFGRNDGSRTGN